MAVVYPKENRNWVFWLVLLVLFSVCVYALRSVLLPFVAGIIIGYLLDPWASYFENHGMNRTLATFLVLFLVIIIMVPALLILFGIIDEQIGRFLNALQAAASSLRRNRTLYVHSTSLFLSDKYFLIYYII